MAGAITDPANLAADYTLLSSHRAHNWVTYGSWNLPIGPGQLLGRNTSGWIGRAIGGFQTSWITTVTSGSPLSITVNNSLYGNGVPDEVNEGFDLDSVNVY